MKTSSSTSAPGAPPVDLAVDRDGRAEEAHRLVDEMGAEVEELAAALRRIRQLAPALDGGAEALEARLQPDDVAERVLAAAAARP